VNGRRYEVTPFPPYTAPFAIRLGELDKMTAGSMEEAKKKSQEIKDAVLELLRDAVSPWPPSYQDLAELYRAVTDMTNAAMVRVDRLFFLNAARRQSWFKKLISKLAYPSQ